MTSVTAGGSGPPRWLAWWILARPAGLWLPPLLPLLGYGWAHWDRALMAYHPWALLPVMLAWLALQAGTLWLNAARDQDTGEVLLGRAVPVPAGTARLGLMSLFGSVALATLAGPGPAACALACAILAVLYSHPRTAWKGHPWLGPAVNVVGYGLLSPLAGYAIVGAPLTPRTAATAVLLATTVLGWTFISQAFQEDEDRARGDRTLVATHGPRVALTAGRACLGAGSAGLVMLAAAGWYPLTVLFALPGAFATDRALARWGRDLAGGERRARSVLRLAALTLALALAGTTLTHLWQSASGQAVAGLGTRAGWPDDRVPRPHAHQQLRDTQHRASTGEPYRPD